MNKLAVEHTSLPGVLVITPATFEDGRGFFMEIYNQKAFEGIGIADRFVQDNRSRSSKNALRGLHLQLPPHAASKLVYCTNGEVFDVAVDLRPSSPAFKRWEGFILSGINKKMVYLPPGFAHGFLALSEAADVTYKMSDFYDQTCEVGVRWNDPDIGIAWPSAAPVLSEKDKGLPSVRDIAEKLKW